MATIDAAGAGSAGIKADLVSAIPSLRAFAVSLCGNSDRADDLVQETLVKAWVGLASFTEGTNLTAWLFTILRNIYYSDYRKRRRETADPDGSHGGAHGVARNPAKPYGFSGFSGRLAEIASRSAGGADPRRTSGLSYDEAAAICGCASGTMKSRVNRARNRLAELLSLSDEESGALISISPRSLTEPARTPTEQLNEKQKCRIGKTG